MPFILQQYKYGFKNELRKRTVHAAKLVTSRACGFFLERTDVIPLNINGTKQATKSP
jgi:hypothetical protein